MNTRSRPRRSSPHLSHGNALAPFKLLAEESFDGVLVADTEGRIIAANNHACQILRYAHDALLGLTLADILDCSDPRTERLHESWQNHRPFQGELYLRTRIGTCLPATVQCRLHLDRETPLATTLVFRDESVRAELDNQQKLLLGAIDRLSDAILVISPRLSKHRGPRIRFANRAFQRITGETSSSCAGKDLQQIFTAASNQPSVNRIASAIDTEESCFVRLEGEDSSGCPYCLEMNVQPVAWEDGKIHSYIALGRDITEERRSVQRLLESEQRFRAIFDQNPAAIFVADLMGNITSCNNAAAAMAGVRPGAVKNVIFTDLLHADDHSRAFKAFIGACKGDTHRLFLCGKTARGQLLDIDVTIVPIVVEDQVIGLTAVVVDITEQVQAQKKLKESEETYRALFDQNPSPIFVTDTDGRITSSNAAAGTLAACAPGDLIGLPFDTLIDTQKDSEIWQAFRDALHGEMRHLVTRGIRRDGIHRDIECTLVPIVVSGESKGVTCIATDITELRKAEEGLRLSAKAMESLAEALTITDLGMRIVSVNKAFTDITGYHEAEIRGTSPFDLMTDSNDPELIGTIPERIADIGHWQGEMWLARKSGDEYPVLMTVSAVYNEASICTHYVIVFTDISQYKRYEERLEFMAHHDYLTHLPNRALFQERVEDAIARTVRHHRLVSVLFIDLDQFKSINDSLGHGIGDALLMKVASRVQALLRHTDTVARLGGDEFAVLLEDLKKPEEVMQVADKLIAAFESPFEVEGYELFTSASIGIVCYPDDGEDAATLLKKADAAMYQAKDYGRNNYRFFSPEINAKAHEYLILANNLRYALERNEFRLHYQPLIELATGTLCGVEALIRWQHPERGLVSPATFIPVAEATGMINQIGTWVLRTACRQAKQWQMAGYEPIRIAVNLSARQFRDSGLAETLSQILAETGLEGRWLELEVTESMMMENPTRVKETMHTLKQKEVSIAIDDFGTGYSSLSYLKEFPFDFIKIDRSFIMGVPESKSDMSITKTIIAMAKSLGITVIAEGVETPGQASYLLEQGCDEGQGYLFSKPVPAEHLESLLRKKTGRNAPTR